MLPCTNIGPRQATFHSAQCHSVTTVTQNQYTSITAPEHNSTQLSPTQWNSHKLHPRLQMSLLWPQRCANKCILLFLRLFQCCLQMKVSLKALGGRQNSKRVEGFCCHGSSLARFRFNPGIKTNPTFLLFSTWQWLEVAWCGWIEVTNQKFAKLADTEKESHLVSPLRVQWIKTVTCQTKMKMGKIISIWQHTLLY